MFETKCNRDKERILYLKNFMLLQDRKRYLRKN